MYRTYERDQDSYSFLALLGSIAHNKEKEREAGRFHPTHSNGVGLPAPGVKISQRSCTDMQELASAWFDEFTLLDMPHPFFDKHRPADIAAFQEKLLLVALNAKKQFQLLQCQ
ncbi:hypothetical protein ccbrp13_29970 [Ktedonobacteria bacterium brp13]|nr:hypothetical protein ccbrp13_29970 [Ktedonobacteria bacterium brp13]